MRRRRPVAVIAAAVAVAATAVALPAQAGGAASGWRVGAAKVDITPPAYNAADDARDFPTCPAGVFSGPRAFDFEEPYSDLNGNGVYDFGEPYCDANANARWDGIFVSGGVGEVATTVHDHLYARAFAISHGTQTVVVASVTAQGLFKNYVDDMRRQARAARPRISGIVVSANHNESSPDTVGIYGAPSLDGAAGGRSGIDDYYMSFLDAQVAHAIVAAYDDLHPGRLSVGEVRVPESLSIRVSNNFPTTDDAGKLVAGDPYVRVLRATDGNGGVFTVMNLAAHNQEIGHGNNPGQLSEDWPGYFERRLDAHGGGTSIFLVGDNGSIEDPAADHDGTYAEAESSGDGFADLVADLTGSLTSLRPGDVRLTTSTFDVPLQNNLFVAAVAAGLFGKRTVDPTGASAQGPVALQTETGVLDVGPDLQLLLWPGEAFPALAVGSHWGVQDAPCADRANPPVATWHAGAKWRFEVGLADDMLGYLLPPWAFATTPGTTQSTCVTDQNDKDSLGHQHKLEDESVGWDAAGDVATQLTALLDKDPIHERAATISGGRYVLADGSLSRSPLGAVGLRLADGTQLSRGAFVDFDGRPQPNGPDLSTAGMRVGGRTYYVDVYPDLPSS
jgi:hypothetical protein